MERGLGETATVGLLLGFCTGQDPQVCSPGSAPSWAGGVRSACLEENPANHSSCVSLRMRMISCLGRPSETKRSGLRLNDLVEIGGDAQQNDP